MSPTQTASDEPGAPVVGEDGLGRCPWAATSTMLREYHDDEWGRPVHGEKALFERVVLEGFQAGLSWSVVLAKRPAFRDAFADFDPDLARHDIIRNRAKVEATRTNAQAVIALRASGGLDHLIWSHRFESPEPPRVASDVPTQSPSSVALAKKLKGHGFRFIGPTSAYALGEAVGLIDPHLLGCHRRGNP